MTEIFLFLLLYLSLEPLWEKPDRRQKVPRS